MFLSLALRMSKMVLVSYSRLSFSLKKEKKNKKNKKEEKEEEEVEWYYAIRVLDNRVKCDTWNYWVLVGVSNGWV